MWYVYVGGGGTWKREKEREYELVICVCVHKHIHSFSSSESSERVQKQYIHLIANTVRTQILMPKYFSPLEGIRAIRRKD